MKTIRHQWLTTHNHSIVLLPEDAVPEEKSFALQQRDGSLINVERVPDCVWTFPVAELPQMFTLMFFNLRKDQMVELIRRNYPEFASIPADKQIIHFIGVKKL